MFAEFKTKKVAIVHNYLIINEPPVGIEPTTY